MGGEKDCGPSAVWQKSCRMTGPPAGLTIAQSVAPLVHLPPFLLGINLRPLLRRCLPYSVEGFLGRVLTTTKVAASDTTVYPPVHILLGVRAKGYVP